MRHVGIAVCLMVCSAPWLLAEHCTENKAVAGEPEQTLAGINLQHDTVQLIMRRLGNPTAHNDATDADHPVGSGYGTYTWQKAKLRVTLSTEFYTDDSGKRVERLEVVEVSGDPSDAVTGTGRGLKLGDDFAQVITLYGSGHVEGGLDPTTPYNVLMFCFSDDTELTIILNRAKHVISLTLRRSDEQIKGTVHN